MAIVLALCLTAAITAHRSQQLEKLALAKRPSTSLCKVGMLGPRRRVAIFARALKCVPLQLLQTSQRLLTLQQEITQNAALRWCKGRAFPRIDRPQNVIQELVMIGELADDLGDGIGRRLRGANSRPTNIQLAISLRAMTVSAVHPPVDNRGFNPFSCQPHESC
jgi:hypothetical protein